LAVHTITPKAGLLGMLAAWLARVPVRVHSFTGQVWVTRTGFMYWLLKAADKGIAALATDVLVDSPSQRDFLIAQGVVTAERSSVLGAGSICGVNTERFPPNESVREIVRNELGTDSDAVVCLYLGRLNHDKGVLDLASAFAQIANKHPRAELWVVGPDEADYFQQMQVFLGKATSQVKRVDFTPTPEQFMQAANLFCLPSYREGFGSSVIEAAACGVPTLASRIYGLTDAVVEGQTGWMHKPGDVQGLSQQLDRLLANPAELVLKGRAAREYVESYFAEEIVTDAMLRFYQKRLP
jgi:glycosyltransferase involved in cell wall biosynthesis